MAMKPPWVVELLKTKVCISKETFLLFRTDMVQTFLVFIPYPNGPLQTVQAAIGKYCPSRDINICITRSFLTQESDKLGNLQEP